MQKLQSDLITYYNLNLIDYLRIFIRYLGSLYKMNWDILLPSSRQYKQSISIQTVIYNKNAGNIGNNNIDNDNGNAGNNNIDRAGAKNWQDGSSIDKAYTGND